MNTNIVSLDELKSFLGVVDDSKDMVLNMMIQSCEGFVRGKCQYKPTDLFEDELKLTACRYIQFMMNSDNPELSGYREGNVQFTYNTSIPTSITDSLDVFIKVRFSLDN